MTENIDQNQNQSTNRGMDRRTLIMKASIRYVLVVLIVGALVFVPAGSLKFWNGWLMMGIFFIPVLLTAIYLIIKDPGLMERRLNLKEKEKPQKIFAALSLIFSILICVIPGLDHRFRWSTVPKFWVFVAAAVMLCAYAICVVVLRQNTYASRVIEIQKEQKLIDTGLYAAVRHPLYMMGLIFFCLSPLVLGSLYGLIPAAGFPIIFVVRLLNEEKVLREGLPGYKEYMQKVRYRLIPYIW